MASPTAAIEYDVRELREFFPELQRRLQLELCREFRWVWRRTVIAVGIVTSERDEISFIVFAGAIRTLTTNVFGEVAQIR